MITPAVLSADNRAKLRAEIEGLAAKLDVAEALVRGQARLLDLLATVLHQAEEIERRVALEEEERQMIVLAIARLGLARPGWQPMLRELAGRLHNAGGAMYDSFQVSNHDLVTVDKLL